ncbi:MAG: hypothetical protein KGV56_05410 [Gammaproteobacteria bacterium]|nr:hypothetical protein [Gammaproteobacteria bacterium]
MSNLTNIFNQLQKLKTNQTEAIVALIDIKTEDDMEKVLNKLDSMESKFEARLNAMDSKFETKFNALESKIYNIRWFIMGSIAVAGLVIQLWDKIPTP